MKNIILILSLVYMAYGLKINSSGSLLTEDMFDDVDPKEF